MGNKSTLPKSMSRSEKIEWWQDRVTELLAQMEVEQGVKRNTFNRISKITRRLKSAHEAIYALRHGETNKETPAITDHAVVRYLQRVKGVDINELKIEIAKYKSVARDGNVIVTVLDDYED